MIKLLDELGYVGSVERVAKPEEGISFTCCR
jgi:hypothetical protein